jgi:CRISPR/Cas system CSM-associated protein Csm3 (group 7 of RAMP superfamily)
MRIVYKITFFDYWHLSSGLSGGAKFDNFVIKDRYSLPYIPGKTIKGVLREIAEEVDKDFVKIYFGENERQGKAFFSNCEIVEKEAIIKNNLQKYLYDTLSFTRLEGKIAVDNSLREIEVVVPVSLIGEIRNIDKNDVDTMKKILGMVRRMGLNRNRGLGRCKIEVEREDEEAI